MTKEEINTRLIEFIQETHDTVTIRLAKPENFEYLPGQFVTIDTHQFDTVKNTERGRKNGPRAYSIASPPTRNYLDITVKKEENGRLSSWFVNESDLKLGDAITIKGPFGSFVYNGHGDIVLLSAGSGIVPLRAMLWYVIDKNLPVSAHLLYSSKTRNDIIYGKELDAIQQPNVHIYHTLTREEWNGRKGRITEVMIKECVGDLNNKKYYICGSVPFTKDLEKILLTNNVPKEKIKTEGWG